MCINVYIQCSVYEKQGPQGPHKLSIIKSLKIKTPLPKITEMWH